MVRIKHPKPVPMTLIMSSNHFRMIQLNTLNGFQIIAVSYYQNKVYYNDVNTII